MIVKMLYCNFAPEFLIEQAGRTCYQSQDKTTEDSHENFCKMLIKSGHESVLEHSFASFRIIGLSRACSHQLVRHRLFSFSQKSQRYVKEESFEYVIPESIKKDPVLLAKYENAMLFADNIYKELLDAKIKPEDARYVLPNACTTEIVMSGNFRNWRHFLKERLSHCAQWEIRNLAEQIARSLKEQAPNIFTEF